MERIWNSSWVVDVAWARAKDDRLVDPHWWVEASVPPEMRVVLVGGAPALGDWDPHHGIELVCNKLPQWFLPQGVAIEAGDPYKFVVLEGDVVVGWEQGENRTFEPSTPQGAFRGAPRLVPRMAGVVVPVFSIRGAGCEGIGDFTALGDFAQWAGAAGMKVVQTLPINDTTMSRTWGDSYPYNSISVFALNPLYVRVAEVDPSADLGALHALEASAAVDYEPICLLKWQALAAAYQKLGEATLESDEFLAFFRRNEDWLTAYALFSSLRDRFGTADFNQWPAPYNRYSESIDRDVYAIGFYYFIQFHADRQLVAARNRARTAGVVFKGDLPIGVSRHSVEVWSDPHLFFLDGQAGAPPDAFAVDGQNWGFPTYNWAEMAKDGYAWWRRRFEKMADYFDAYRIDHILGFFRIWEIPVPEKSGLAGHFSPALPFSVEQLTEKLGFSIDPDHETLFVRDHQNPTLLHPAIAAQQSICYRQTLSEAQRERFDTLYTDYFYHRHNDFWAAEALAKLPPLIDATRMLCCAEDLGMIPACVAPVLDRLQVATLEVERMPKEPYCEFGSVDRYPWRSVATTSSHDISTLRGWWVEEPQTTQRYYNQVLGFQGEAPLQATTSVCTAVVERHLACPSMLVILPIQDWIAVDENLRLPDPLAERINVPANANHPWRYRLHLRVDELMAAGDFNAALGEMIRVHQR